MGVSSLPRTANIRLISACASGFALGYGAAKSAHAEVREVNQSPEASRRRRGRKCDSTAWAERRSEILEILSDA